MAKNYGISFCKKVLKDLEDLENKMFSERGHGFDLYGPEFKSELRYKRLLKEFEKEKRLGLTPSYDPNADGSFSD